MRVTHVARYLCLCSSLLLAPAVASAAPITHDFAGDGLSLRVTLDDAGSWVFNDYNGFDEGWLTSPSMWLEGTFNGYSFFGVPKLHVLHWDPGPPVSTDGWVIRAQGLTSNELPGVIPAAPGGIGPVTLTGLTLAVSYPEGSLTEYSPYLDLTGAISMHFHVKYSNNEGYHGVLIAPPEPAPKQVPEPASAGLFALGLAAVAVSRRRSRAA